MFKAIFVALFFLTFTTGIFAEPMNLASDCPSFIRFFRTQSYPRSGNFQVLRRTDNEAGTFLTARVGSWNWYQIGIGGGGRDTHGIWDFVSLYPDFARSLGYVLHLNTQSIQYPDAATLNQKISNKKFLSTRYWSPSAFSNQNVSTTESFSHLAKREAVAAVSGRYHFHDAFGHWFYLIIPEDIWGWIEKHTAAIQMLRRSPVLKSARKFQKLLTHLEERIVDQVDLYTAGSGNQFSKRNMSIRFSTDFMSERELLESIVDGLTDRAETLVQELYKESAYSHINYPMGFNIPLSEMEVEQNSPRFFWKRWTDWILKKDRYHLDLGLTEEQVWEIHRLSGRFSKMSLSEDRLQNIFTDLLKEFGSPNMTNFRRISEYDEAHSPWSHLLQRP